MANLRENADRVISDFNNVKSALEENGVNIPTGTPTSEYGSMIRNVAESASAATATHYKTILDSISEAIEEKGVDVSEAVPYTEYSDKIREIPDPNQKPYINTAGISDFSYFCYSDRFNMEQLKTIDTSNGTNFYAMFYKSVNLETIPQIDTSKGLIFDGMFESTKIKSIPQLDYSKGTDFYMFCKQSSLETGGQFNTSSGTNFAYMFSQCTNLTSIEGIDTSNGTKFSNMFFYCDKLIYLPELNLTNANAIANMFTGCKKLENISFSGIRIFDNAFSLADSPLLTVESLLSCLNALQNTDETVTRTVALGSTNLAKLSDEQKAIATAKNIMLI